MATSFSNADEISKADGNEEKAKTVKQKASENVSGLFNTINPLAWYTHTSDSTNISFFFNEWKEYQEANPEASHSHQACFKFHNKKMQEWYEEADIEKKKEVEEFQQKPKDELLEGGDDPSRLLQEWAI